MRTIDADALKDSLCFPCDRSETGYTIDECRKKGCGMMAVIDNQPTIEAEPVRHWRCTNGGLTMDEKDYELEKAIDTLAGYCDSHCCEDCSFHTCDNLCILNNVAPLEWPAHWGELYE